MEPSTGGAITVAADGEAQQYTRGDIRDLERHMWEAVERLDFERAAELRDQINQIKSNGTDKGGFAGGGMDKNYRRPSAQLKKHRRRAAKR